ncbi:short chain dehydrogenase domain-containing protein [Sarocladium implicatum]|nr:short chain dehydrogenase domain-containing protein [Sarocladium implicatum]
MAPLVWLITGVSSGLGAAILDEAVSRGDKVIAANRQVSQISSRASDNVSLLELDISSGAEVIESKVKEAWQVFGHIDVLVNNAGTFAIAPFEETSDKIAERMFQVNLFGHLNVTRAILPFFREQGSGCITFSASNQVWSNLPYTSLYNMTKSATSSFAETLHKEVSLLGIRCVAFECGGTATRFFEPREKDKVADQKSDQTSIEAYVPGMTDFTNVISEWGLPTGDAAKMAKAMVDVVRGEGKAAGRPWSSRIPLGSDAVRWSKLKRQQGNVVTERWEDIANATDRDDAVFFDGMDKYVKMPGAA